MSAKVAILLTTSKVIFKSLPFWVTTSFLMEISATTNLVPEDEAVTSGGVCALTYDTIPKERRGTASNLFIKSEILNNK
jgi:hypothetical protein